MKLDKFTKVLINLVLILAIALLLKYLIIAPMNLYSTTDDITTHQAPPKPKSTYKEASSKPNIIVIPTSFKYLQQAIDQKVKEGYKLHDIDIEHMEYDASEIVIYLIFKR